MIEEVPPTIDSLQIPDNPGTDGYRKHAAQAEATLTELQKTTSSPSDLNDSILLQLTAYTNPSSPWSTPSSSLIARSLLSALPPDRASHLVVDTILQGYLRPIFSKATAKVTASGRPSQYPEQKPGSGAARGGWEEPAWKMSGLAALPTFAWAVEVSDSDLIKSNWPLFTPVLLTLLEDRDTSIRKTGLKILMNFLSKCPPNILTSTGIGTVFQDAIFPTLLYLPSLTPEPESITLLRPAYAALLALAKTDEDTGSAGRRKQLDKLLRDGVFAAYHHASEYIHIVEILMDVTADIVSALSIYSAKHLQSIMSMISSVMTDPFATAHGKAILSACKALNTCIRDCWPTVTEERSGEVMRMIIMCWLHVHSAKTGPKMAESLVQVIETELKLTSKMLYAIREDNGHQTPPELLEIVQKEPELKALFPYVDSPSP